MNMEDATQEILLRLPVKSLARCKALSKEWREYISHNQSFRDSYIDRNKECSFMLGLFVTKHKEFLDGDEHVHFLPTNDEGRILDKRKMDGGADGSLLLDEPPKKTQRRNSEEDSLIPALSFLSDPAVRVLGSSNGFLLCSRDDKCPLNYIIYNPINKLCLSLPVASQSSIFYSHGFICRSMSPRLDTIDYYKVVRGISPEDWDEESPATLEIISSDSTEWSLFDVSVPFPFFLDSTDPSRLVISETGLIYVPGEIIKQEKSDFGVVIFDEKKLESVQLIEYPPTENDWIGWGYFGLSEGLVLYARRELGQLKIWMITDTREWSLIHHVNLESWKQIYPEIFKTPGHVQFYFVALHPRNKNVIFINGDFHKVLMYDLAKSKLEFVCEFEAQGWELAYDLHPYTSGLVGPHLFLTD